VLNAVFLGERGDKAAIERGRSKLPELEPIIEDGLTGRAFLALRMGCVASCDSFCSSCWSNARYLREQAEILEVQIKRWHECDEASRRRAEIPGIGAPDRECARR
jgi:hypothetical protein